MPKLKQFPKEKKTKASKHAAQAPQTADEYLAVGVDFEEAGEKWRGGDAAKSMRFFVRAIDVYDEALRKFQDSFDLAYNKSRVQYELTQHPRLAAQLPGTLLDLLKTALESSRHALNLRQDNADVLFNTAQVLTSLVEALTGDRSGSTSREDGLRLLEEALELFQRCLILQEYHFTESKAQEEAAVSTLQPDDLALSAIQSSSSAQPLDISNADDAATSESQEERWATIVEPVTNATLLDTVLAQLETLATLCGLITVDEGRGLAWVEEYSTNLISNKLPAYVQGTNREEEAALTRADFIAALADANFRSRRIDASTYERAIEEAFAPLDLVNRPESLCHKAEALIVYSSALGVQALDASRRVGAAALSWKSLTVALDALTAASKLPSTENLAKIHLMRGDVELLRYQLGQPPASYETATKNNSTLLKNASTYYRGAESHGVALNLKVEAKEAVIKLALVAALGGNGEKLKELMDHDISTGQRVLEEAVDDGLLGIEWLIRQGFVKG